MPKPKQPLLQKDIIHLLSRMEIIEFALEAAACGDNGPLTCSPTQRRNMVIILRAVARKFEDIAREIDPIGPVPRNEDIPLPTLP